MPRLLAFAVFVQLLVVACEETPSVPAPPSSAPAVAEPGPLFAEDFADATSLARWTRVVGASVGAGDESEVAWDEGALRLRGDAATARWTALTRSIEVGQARWLELTARVRSDGVEGAGARFRNSNLYVRAGESFVTTGVFDGTRPWTQVRRLFELPAGTTRVELGLFLSMPGSAWFDDVRLEVVPAPQWSVQVAGRWRYHTLPGDAVDEAARRYNEDSWRIVSEFLEVAGPQGVDFYKYPDLETKAALFGRGGNAHRVGTHIHSIWASDRHEIVHVLADAWGDPPALLAEGLAVHLSGSWQGLSVRDAARALVGEGLWSAPCGLLDSATFRARDDRVSYAVGGAFVAWLEAVHGRDVLRALYGELENRASLDENRRRLEARLGASSEAIDAQVLRWLESEAP